MKKWFLILPMLFFCCLFSALYANDADQGLKAGYPRTALFRQESPQQLRADAAKVDMVISDQGVWTRQYEHEKFAAAHPDVPVLIHAYGEFISANAYSPKQMLLDSGVLQEPLKSKFIAYRKGYAEILSEDMLPMPDFLGFWVYEAGLDALEDIAGGEKVNIKVFDSSRFARRNIVPPPNAKEIDGDGKTNRIVVLCPRDKDGKLDWVKAELAEVESALDGEISVRRFNVGGDFPKMARGTYVAASMPMWDRVTTFPSLSGKGYEKRLWQFFVPNFTKFCPADPHSGLNASQWFARHYLEKKKKIYPHSSGFALDQCTETFFDSRDYPKFADFNNDGVVDRSFIDGVNWWGLGMFDFVYYMRFGVAGKFDGMDSSKLVLTWDSNKNSDQRFFDLINGAEYEHTMIPHSGSGNSILECQFSTNMDRLLLWSEKGASPKASFVSSKFPDEAYNGYGAEAFEKVKAKKPSYSLAHFRLNLAATCMAEGFYHRAASRASEKGINEYSSRRAEVKEYGAALLQDYDEYHRGDDNIRNWLGQPLGSAKRYALHLSEPLYAWASKSPLPEIRSESGDWQAEVAAGKNQGEIVFDVKKIGRYSAESDKFKLRAAFTLGGLKLERDADYAMTFKVASSSPFAAAGERYAAIPRNISIRLSADGDVNGGRTGVALKNGLYQDVFCFLQERAANFNLKAPASGVGCIEICLSEAAGKIHIKDLELRKGSPDVLYREFENGVVLLNGSSSESVDIDIQAIFPGKKFRHIKGTQAPALNDGSSVGRYVRIPPEDAVFLVKSK